MTSKTPAEPIYIFRVTPQIASRWIALGTVLFLAATSAVSAYYQVLHKQPWVFQITGQGNSIYQTLLVFLGSVALVMGLVMVHEAIHGVAFAMFGGSPRYGMGAKYFLPFAYTTSPGDRFSRNAFIWIGLAPLIVIDAVGLLLLAVFPQATWLGWVVVLNTAGAIGDLWIVALLLRCPSSIKVEDRKEGVALYAPDDVHPQAIPLHLSNSRSRSALITWLDLTMTILATLILIAFVLPIILSSLQVPSFAVGIDTLWILRWENNSNGFGLTFAPLPLLMIAVLFGLVGFGWRAIKQSRRSKRPRR